MTGATHGTDPKAAAGCGRHATVANDLHVPVIKCSDSGKTNVSRHVSAVSIGIQNAKNIFSKKNIML